MQLTLVELSFKNLLFVSFHEPLIFVETVVPYFRLALLIRAILAFKLHLAVLAYDGLTTFFALVDFILS